MPSSAPYRRSRYRVPPPNRLRGYKPQNAQQQVSPDQAWLRQVLGGLSSLLVLLGVLLYGCLSIIYGSFYEALGVNLSDVGLNYTGVLSNALSYVVILLFVLGCFALPLIVIWIFMEGFPRAAKGPWQGIRRFLVLSITEGTRQCLRTWLGKNPRRWPRNATLIAGTLILLLTVQQSAFSSLDAMQVRAGHPVITSPIIGPISLEVFAIRADPVMVSTVDKPDNSPIVKELTQQTNLLYLGQAGGTVVLYDPTQLQAIYLPASTVVLKIATCRTRYSNPRCINGIPF
jgi:hypothetical protein